MMKEAFGAATITWCTVALPSFYSPLYILIYVVDSCNSLLNLELSSTSLLILSNTSPAPDPKLFLCYLLFSNISLLASFYRRATCPAMAENISSLLIQLVL